MIGGASQADLAVLVISARKGEFETGFERGGQVKQTVFFLGAYILLTTLFLSSVKDPSIFDADPDSGSALEKNGSGSRKPKSCGSNGSGSGYGS